MAQVAISTYNYCDAQGNSIIPLGAFSTELYSEHIKVGYCLQSSVAGCIGIIAGWTWENELAIKVLTLTVYQ